VLPCKQFGFDDCITDIKIDKVIDNSGDRLIYKGSTKVKDKFIKGKCIMMTAQGTGSWDYGCMQDDKTFGLINPESEYITMDLLGNPDRIMRCIDTLKKAIPKPSKMVRFYFYVLERLYDGSDDVGSFEDRLNNLLFYILKLGGYKPTSPIIEWLEKYESVKEPLDLQTMNLLLTSTEIKLANDAKKREINQRFFKYASMIVGGISGIGQIISPAKVFTGFASTAMDLINSYVESNYKEQEFRDMIMNSCVTFVKAALANSKDTKSFLKQMRRFMNLKTRGYMSRLSPMCVGHLAGTYRDRIKKLSTLIFGTFITRPEELKDINIPDSPATDSLMVSGFSKVAAFGFESWSDKISEDEDNEKDEKIDTIVDNTKKSLLETNALIPR